MREPDTVAVHLDHAGPRAGPGAVRGAPPGAPDAAAHDVDRRLRTPPATSSTCRTRRRERSTRFEDAEQALRQRERLAGFDAVAVVQEERAISRA